MTTAAAPGVSSASRWMKLHGREAHPQAPHRPDCPVAQAVSGRIELFNIASPDGCRPAAVCPHKGGITSRGRVVIAMSAR